MFLMCCFLMVVFQSEAVRMARQQLPKQSCAEMSEVVKELRRATKGGALQCFHDKPIVHQLHQVPLSLTQVELVDDRLIVDTSGAAALLCEAQGDLVELVDDRLIVDTSGAAALLCEAQGDLVELVDERLIVDTSGAAALLCEAQGDLVELVDDRLIVDTSGAAALLCEAQGDLVELVDDRLIVDKHQELLLCCVRLRGTWWSWWTIGLSWTHQELLLCCVRLRGPGGAGGR